MNRCILVTTIMDFKDQIENAKIESIKLISAKFLTESLDDEDIRKEIN